jgi:hypothetical protein
MAESGATKVGEAEGTGEPSKEELQVARVGSVNTDALRFVGLRGDSSRHLSRAALEAGIAGLQPPRDRGTVDLLVSRGPEGERHLHQAVDLTVAGGMPGDRWGDQTEYGLDYQLATTRTDVARLIANGQPLELHGDNLFLSLDLSTENLPCGSLVRLGSVLLRVTPVPHNGCKKWVQRFGLAAMQLNLDRAYRGLHVRGIYLRVIESGRVQVGDTVHVVERGSPAAAG